MKKQQILWMVTAAGLVASGVVCLTLWGATRDHSGATVKEGLRERNGSKVNLEDVTEPRPLASKKSAQRRDLVAQLEPGRDKDGQVDSESWLGLEDPSLAQRYGSNVFYYAGPIRVVEKKSEDKPMAPADKAESPQAKRVRAKVELTPEQVEETKQNSAMIGEAANEQEIQGKEDRLIELFPNVKDAVQRNRERRSDDAN